VHFVSTGMTRPTNTLSLKIRWVDFGNLIVMQYAHALNGRYRKERMLPALNTNPKYPFHNKKNMIQMHPEGIPTL
jgi:hypothetical protein